MPGRLVEREGVRATHANSPEIAAAKNQHEFSRAVRDQKHTHSITDEDIATDLKLSANHIGRYSRGETTVPTLVMHRIAQRVGLDLTITLTPRAEA